MSRVLVLLQFLLIGLIAFPSWDSARWWPGIFITLCGVALGFWSLFHNRPGRFNIRPEVHPKAILVTSGPYHFIRHPMYSAVFLFCLGLSLVHQTLLCLVSLVLIVPVLWLKTLREERYMMIRFPEYALFMSSTRRFIPFFI